jgi:hypothetical protein
VLLQPDTWKHEHGQQQSLPVSLPVSPPGLHMPHTAASTAQRLDKATSGSRVLSGIL